MAEEIIKILESNRQTMLGLVNILKKPRQNIKYYLNKLISIGRVEQIGKYYYIKNI